MSKIIVTYHKEINKIPEWYLDNKYINILGGKQVYNGTNQFMKNMKGDNTGKNISKYNPWLNQLTTIYWAYYHLDQIADNYIGFMHYRRKLNFNELLNQNTIITVSTDLKWPINRQIYIEGGVSKEDFIKYQNFYLTLLSQQQKQLYYEYINKHHMFYTNIFITHKNIFKEYFIELQKLINFSIEQDINLNIKNRIPSFILERFSGFILYKLSKIKNINLIDMHIDWYTTYEYKNS